MLRNQASLQPHKGKWVDASLRDRPEQRSKYLQTRAEIFMSFNICGLRKAHIQ